MLKFKTEKVTDRVTRIYAFCTELMYLVEGEKQAALIDTGSGFGSLKAVVENLTDKPVIVLLTHGHADHAMGSGEFRTVYMNRMDEDIYTLHGAEGFRREGMKMSGAYRQMEESDYIPTVPCSCFADLKEGDHFDLGSLMIEIYECPGHTKGSVVMLLREEKILLTGDACNNRTFLFEDYSLPLGIYEKSLRHLKQATDGKYDRVLISHGGGEVPADIIDSMIELCGDIRAGRVDDVPFQFRGSKGFVAKKTNDSGLRLDGKSANIVYRKIE